MDKYDEAGNILFNVRNSEWINIDPNNEAVQLIQEYLHIETTSKKRSLLLLLITWNIDRLLTSSSAKKSTATINDKGKEFVKDKTKEQIIESLKAL